MVNSILFFCSIVVWLCKARGLSVKLLDMNAHESCDHMMFYAKINLIFIHAIQRVIELLSFFQTPTWSQSDMCEKCASPFFWNFKQMWDQKMVGVRQVSLFHSA